MNHLHITYTNLVVVYKELRTNQLQPLELLIYQHGNTFALNIFISPTRGIGISFLLFGFFRFFLRTVPSTIRPLLRFMILFAPPVSAILVI